MNASFRSFRTAAHFVERRKLSRSGQKGMIFERTRYYNLSAFSIATCRTKVVFRLSSSIGRRKAPTKARSIPRVIFIVYNMRVYKFLVSTAFSLAVMFFISYAVGLFALPNIPWLYSLNRPVFAPSFLVHQILGGVVVALKVILLAMTAYHKELRKAFWLVLPAVALTVLWAFLLFAVKVPYGAFAVCLLTGILWCFSLDYYVRATRELWLIALPITAYHLYILTLGFSLVFLN